jgi:ribosome-binding protein aMBF1 (putative translation factor)
MSREEVARQLEWSTSTIFRIETGRSRPQPGNVRTLLDAVGDPGYREALDAARGPVSG